MTEAHIQFSISEGDGLQRPSPFIFLFIFHVGHLLVNLLQKGQRSKCVTGIASRLPIFSNGIDEVQILGEYVVGQASRIFKERVPIESDGVAGGDKCACIANKTVRADGLW